MGIGSLHVTRARLLSGGKNAASDGDMGCFPQGQQAATDGDRGQGAGLKGGA